MLYHLRLPIAAALFAVSVQAIAEPIAWNDWVRGNSPHGTIISKDGTIWINAAAAGLRNDYAVRAGDLRDARENGIPQPKFWVRGFHLKNKDVKYRNSMSQYQLDCKSEKIKTILEIFYDASGNIISENRDSSYETIIPDTYGAEFHKLFCLVGR